MSRWELGSCVCMFCYVLCWSQRVHTEPTFAFICIAATCLVCACMFKALGFPGIPQDDAHALVLAVHAGPLLAMYAWILCCKHLGLS